MKLLNFTAIRFAILLFALLSAWAVIFYFEMLDEIYDSMDDGLENQKMIVIQRAKENPEILDKPHFEDTHYTIKEKEYNEVKNFKDSYRDTLMYMQNEEDFEPVRLLETVFAQDGSYYQLKVITSMVEEDDLIKELFFSLFWLYLGLILSILVLNNFILQKVWDPFYKLLAELKVFRIEKDKKIKLQPTGIEEFSLLNERIKQLVEKSVVSYHNQKQFIENASHELQTPLAISINKLELLAEQGKLEKEQLEILSSVLNNLENLTRFNKSLLLLSKIENKQFVEEESINFNELVKQIASDFEDIAAHKNISFLISEKGKLQYNMNRDLAIILVSNLIKNAVVHGSAPGTVEMEISGAFLKIKNYGIPGALDADKIFSRFQKAGNDKKSTGLGLAISKAISEKFGIDLRYEFDGQHIFTLGFPKS